MIVQPNFLDHHKTRQLVLELGGDELAPLYVLRLWAHCQNQKKSRFAKMSATALCAICCAKCSPEQLWLALQNSGFVRLRGDVLIVHEWDEYNQSLLTSWENGKKGGRKLKAQLSTRGEPGENPRVTGGGSDREDKIEKRREDREEGVQGIRPPPPPAGASPDFSLSHSSPSTAPKAAARPKLTDAEWLASLKNDAAYAGLDVDREHAKATVWCRERRKVLTRQRFINWLNRCDRPLSNHTPPPRKEPQPPANWRSILRRLYPDAASDLSWSTLADSIRDQIRREAA
jgi:hypothetical protein